MKQLRKLLFGISPDETSFSRRGFHASDPAARQRLEGIGATFLEGYHAALDTENTVELAARLEQVPREARGFAYEGAAMSLALLDALTPWRRNRVAELLEGPGACHLYMIHVGVGWAYARLPWLRRNIVRAKAGLDPLLGWLAVDGYRFHEGYFYAERTIGRQQIPSGVNGYARNAFDQGLGRVLWFVNGAEVDRVVAAIHAFPEDRRADLWSGVGLASSYAGGVSRGELERLREASGACYPMLAQGATFAAGTRLRAGNVFEHTQMAVGVYCGVSVEEAARMTDVALRELAGDGTVPTYEIWRRRIQKQFTQVGARS